MEGNNSSLGLETVLRLRVPGELKSALAEAAKKRRQKPSQFVRNVLWDVVDNEEKAPAKASVPTPPSPLENVETR